jgi:putative ABC transport system permease protein
MRPVPVARAVRGGLTRRRVQTTVIAVVLLVSTAASVLAVALLADSSSPFDRAFAAQHGAHVIASVDPSRATPAELAATARLPGVSAAAGPFALVTITPTVTGPIGAQTTLPPMTLAGRASPGGPVDDITVQSGHWATGPGQIVLDSNSTGGAGFVVPLGTKIVVTSTPGKPALTVVGIANSVTGTADGWVTPSEVTSLQAHRTPAAAEMLYRFRSASTAAAIRADAAAVSAALPAGAVTGTQSYLSAKIAESSGIAPFTPFVVAFGIIGLVMSVLIVANVVSGAVVAGYRRIGILKSIGFTPGQVVAAYTGQVTVCAVAGCLLGVVLGNLLAIPLLGKTANAYGVGSLGVPAWVDLAVPVTMCCLVGIAALLPALRAGRFSAAQAIAAGRAPRTGRGYAAHRLLGKLRLPRPVTIGLAAPFARPARTTATLAAILLGAIAVTFAVGLSSSLYQVLTGLRHTAAAPVQVQLASGGPGRIVKVNGAPVGAGQGGPPGAGTPPTANAAQHAVTAALRAQPGTLRYVAQADQQVSVAGLTQQIPVTAFRGNASWVGYEMISGRWYTGADQVDVPTAFLTTTGKAVGDWITITFGGKQIPVRIVGQVFDTDNNGLAMFTGWQTLASADPGLAPDQYDVGLRPGTSADAYAQALSTVLGDNYFVGARGEGSTFPIVIGLIGTLTLMLTIMAGLGVLNTVVLHTRERVHDLGVFKAIGMTPRQTITMVVCWVAGTGLVAGLIAVPAGIALHHYVLPVMAAAAGTGLPAVVLNVYRGPELIALALAGIVIAVVAALLPASWAAATRTASALHAE